MKSFLKSRKYSTYILDTKRSAIGLGKASGALSHIHPVDLLSRVLNGVTSNIPKNRVEDVIAGCVTPIGEQGGNIARIALLKAGIPYTTPGVTINRMCGSSQQAVHFAQSTINAGEQDMNVACGVEMMSRVQMLSDSPKEYFGMDIEKRQFSFGTFLGPLIHQGLSAELLAQKYSISREACDNYAIRSHELFHHALERGIFSDQVIPIESYKKDKEGNKIEGTDYSFERDEGVRFPSNEEKLRSLKPVFLQDGGVVTGGNASQISDGASAVLLGNEKVVKEFGLNPKFIVKSHVVVGSDPTIMLDGPIFAIDKLLKKENLSVNDIDIFEVNEAFACVALAVQNTLNIPDEKFNPNGGAIAHGHPLGATGGLLFNKVVAAMEEQDLSHSIVSMCIGHGHAVAALVSRV